MYIPQCSAADCTAPATKVLSLMVEGIYHEYPYCDRDVRFFADAVERYGMKVTPL